MGVNILKELGFNDEEILHAILAHNNKVPLETLMDKALYLSDPTSGFIVACALILPLLRCKELLNLELSEFLNLCLEGLKLVRSELEL